MKYLSGFVLLLLLVSRLNSQNLLSNPGFEDGMNGWDNLWVRTPGTGQALAVDSPVNSGKKAAYILHKGSSDDWSFKHSGNYYVKPGEVYEFSVYVNVIAPGNNSCISIAAFDSSGGVISWGLASQAFDTTSNSYRKYLVRFIIPRKCAWIWARFTGADSCELYLDDCELKKTGSGIERTFTLDNEKLHAEIFLPALNMSVKDKLSGKIYGTNSPASFIITSFDSSVLSYTFHTGPETDSTKISYKISLIGDGLKFEVIPQSVNTISKGFFFPDYIESSPEDYLIVPYATGLMIPVTEDFPVYTLPLGGYKATMAFAGVTNLNSGYMLITEDPWDSEIQFSKRMGSKYNSFRIFHMPSKGKTAYRRVFYMFFFQSGGYIEMANRYRDHAAKHGYIKTFEEKLSDNPNMLKLKGAIDFWLMDRDFYKQQFIDSLYFSGVDRAIFSLSEESLSGDAYAAFIDSINSKGYLSSRYDIYTDIFPPTHPEYSWYRTKGYPEDLIVNKDGTYKTGWVSYLPDKTPFQGYYSCSATHSAYARQWITEDLVKKHYNCRFIDVELSSVLTECYSPLHPESRHDDALKRIELLNTVKNKFQLVTGSEEAKDWAFPMADYGEGTMTIYAAVNAGYDWSTPVDTPGANYINYTVSASRRIPLHGLVYHDVHVPTWYTGDGQSKVPAYWDDKDLFNILYASMPLFMPLNKNHWRLNEEKFLNSANLVSGVFRCAGFSKMTAHRFLSDDKEIQQTEFSNGWKSTVNFGKTDYSFNNILLPPKGFYAGDGISYVYRIKNGVSTSSVCSLPDRLFINPNGSNLVHKGIRTSSSVLLQKSGSSLSLVFIGSGTYADINPTEIPWPLKNIKIRSRFHPEISVSLQDIGGGWKRLNSQSGEKFYILEGDFTSPVEQINESSIYSYRLSQNYPNPFNMSTKISYSLKESGMTKLIIFDILGREVKLLRNSEMQKGNYSIEWDGTNNEGLAVSSGTYLLRISSGNFNKAIKMQVFK
ncbi:MAG: glycoside hydrolase [Bacillota bacterium]